MTGDSLLPRNDAGNSRIYCDEIPRSSRGMTQGLGNSRIPRDCFASLAMTDEFRIYYDEIPRSSRGMTKKVKLGDDKKHKSGDGTRLMRSSGQARG